MRFGLILESDNDTAPPALDPSMRVGPLRFPAPLSELGESLGDGLEASGAALIMGERRARPFKLELAVHGDYSNPSDPRTAGLRLRRQLRQLLENTAWRKQGVYLYWSADPELSGWLMVGGGELTETDPGVTFGEFKLELTDCYYRGRPGTHRPGRRIDVADRRTGLVPLDTRGLLYSTDRADYVAQPRAFLPGDVANVTSSTGTTPARLATSDLLSGRRLFSAYAATDGDVLSYVPTLLGDSVAQTHGDLDTPGALRVWDTRGTTMPVQGSTGGAVADAEPSSIGWERVYGPLLDYTTPLAVDNGLCRLVWIPAPAGAGGGLTFDTFDPSTFTYRRLGRFVGLGHGDLANAEASVLELTPERAVLEWKTGGRALRAILQRGWTGPRLEHYTEPLGILSYVPAPGTASDDVQWQSGRLTDSYYPSPTYPGGVDGSAASGGVFVQQIAPDSTPMDEVLSLAVMDVRAEPVLLRRGS